MPSSSTDETRRAHVNDLVDRALALLLEHDMSAFADLWAPNGSIEFPFAASGYPSRVDGREAIREYLSGYTKMLDVRGIASQIRHQTDDPDTVIIEFEVDGRAVANGNSYRMRYIAVITARPDGIASYRDYWSPLAGAETLGVDTEQLHSTVTGVAR